MPKDRFELVAPPGWKHVLQAAAKARGTTINRWVLEVIRRELDPHELAQLPPMRGIGRPPKKKDQP